MAKNEEFTGLQKAAILLITLGPERSADIFKHLKEDEIEELTLEIANTRSISPQVKEDVLNEFYQICLAQQYIAEGGIDDAHVCGIRLNKPLFIKIRQRSRHLRLLRLQSRLHPRVYE